MKKIVNKSPLVSVCVPVYNAEKYLRECIDSILAQTFTDFELLIVDFRISSYKPIKNKIYFLKWTHVMKKNIISLDLIQDIPAIETMAEGKLRGGFSSLSFLSSGSNDNGDCSNIPCTNSDCKNKICKNGGCDNATCSNGTCASVTTAAPTATSTPTPSGASLLGGGAFSILGF